MARNAHRKAERDLQRAPDAGHFGERADESIVRRIEDLDDESLDPALGPDRINDDDAGADLAEDFGREFLLSATTGEDIGEIESAAAEAAEKEGLGLHEVEIENSLEPTLEDLTAFAVADEPKH